MIYKGKYVNGSGRASLVSKMSFRVTTFKNAFKTSMLGTFNIRVDGGFNFNELPEPHYTSIDYEKEEGTKFNWWLVRLTNSSEESCYAYLQRWEGTGMTDLELVSKKLIPDSFKKDSIDIEVFDKWSRDEINAWVNSVETRDRFQGHHHDSMKRSDSSLVWDQIKHIDYSGRKVLDIGCNTGFFSFEVSKNGGIVTAIDREERVLNVARTIQKHITMTDIDFLNTSCFSWWNRFDGYDVIIYNSVHHQMDPKYKLLASTIKHLKNHCKILVLELINPPLEGPLTKDGVDSIVNEFELKEVFNYKHKVRNTRSIYIG